MTLVKLLNGKFIDENLIIPTLEWKKGHSYKSYLFGKVLRPPNVKGNTTLAPRGVRRNLARDEHALITWRSGKHHVRIRKGNIVVPFS